MSNYNNLDGDGGGGGGGDGGDCDGDDNKKDDNDSDNKIIHTSCLRAVAHTLHCKECRNSDSCVDLCLFSWSIAASRNANVKKVSVC